MGRGSEDLHKPFSLAIVDIESLAYCLSHIREVKKAAEPAILPFLLVARQNCNLAKHHLWRTVDEVIFVPIEKFELQARVEILLRVHRLSWETMQLAVSDYLTGLYNRRQLMALGEREFAKLSRYQRPMAAIMFDLDHFKLVNDTYGHRVGDLVLQQLAGCCQKCVRDIDILGRYGGDEFVVFLPETDMEGAVRVAERLRREVASEPLETDAGKIPITISLESVPPDLTQGMCWT